MEQSEGKSGLDLSDSESEALEVATFPSQRYPTIADLAEVMPTAGGREQQLRGLAG